MSRNKILIKYIQQAHICSKFKFNKIIEDFNSISNTIIVQNIISFDNIIFNNIFIRKIYRFISILFVGDYDGKNKINSKFRDYSGIFEGKSTVLKSIIIIYYN